MLIPKAKRTKKESVNHEAPLLSPTAPAVRTTFLSRRKEVGGCELKKERGETPPPPRARAAGREAAAEEGSGPRSRTKRASSSIPAPRGVCGGGYPAPPFPEVKCQCGV